MVDICGLQPKYHRLGIGIFIHIKNAVTGNDGGCSVYFNDGVARAARNRWINHGYRKIACAIDRASRLQLNAFDNASDIRPLQIQIVSTRNQQSIQPLGWVTRP